MKEIQYEKGAVWGMYFPMLSSLEDDRFKSLNDNLDNSKETDNTLPMGLKQMEASTKFIVDLKPVKPMELAECDKVLVEDPRRKFNLIPQ